MPNRKEVSISASAVYDGEASKDAAVSFSGEDDEIWALWASLTLVICQWIGMTLDDMFRIFSEGDNK